MGIQGEDMMPFSHVSGPPTDHEPLPKARNALYFGPDADVSPLLPVGNTSTIETRQAPREINHANTRMPDEEEDEGGTRAGNSRRGTSPSRSAVGAAISGTPCKSNAISGAFEQSLADPIHRLFHGRSSISKTTIL